MPVFRVESVGGKAETEKFLGMMMGGNEPGVWWIRVVRAFNEWVRREEAKRRRVEMAGKTALRRKLDQRSLSMRLKDKRVDEEYEAVYAQQMVMMQARVPPPPPPQQHNGQEAEEGVDRKFQLDRDGVKKEVVDE